MCLFHKAKSDSLLISEKEFEKLGWYEDSDDAKKERLSIKCHDLNGTLDYCSQYATWAYLGQGVFI